MGCPKYDYFWDTRYYILSVGVSLSWMLGIVKSLLMFLNCKKYTFQY